MLAETLEEDALKYREASPLVQSLDLKITQAFRKLEQVKILRGETELLLDAMGREAAL